MKVLVANRGEIAVRLIRACQELGLHSTAIYAEEDVSALHVRLADKAVALDDTGSRAYLDSRKIVKICKDHEIQAVIPGYGFLSENDEFVQLLQESKIVFVGPTSETIKAFGLKHSARELAIQANVPVVPGTGIITTTEEAQKEAARLGYPVIVKATAGGGGMGLQVCHSPKELDGAVATVRSRGAALFRNSGLFLEKFVENGRHIEGQIFGNGAGDVLWFGERECSIQRRHQKVLEESPSPYVVKNPELRDKLRKASVSLAASIKYKSVGTVEFLVDDETGDFYFLEMNTRLQVEHGVTELCYEVDLVHLMLLQAKAEVQGMTGLTGLDLQQYERTAPKGHAIEVRVYAENPAKDFRPAPGLLTNVEFPLGKGVRVDSWVERGTLITPSFDPLIAKIMVHQVTRDEALELMLITLSKTILCGPPTNINFLQAIISNKDVQAGYTTTNLLETRFSYQAFAIDFSSGGIYTTVQDLPGRQGYSNGIPVSGPMDSVSFRIANMLVGNDENMEALELTHSGPQFTVHGGAVIALCGAAFDFHINGSKVEMWTRHILPAGAQVSIGGRLGFGCRAYLAIAGGLPTVGRYLNSKSTTPTLDWGGYQGRTIRAGDFLFLDKPDPNKDTRISGYTVPLDSRPNFENVKTINTLPGPYDSDEFLAPEGQQAFYDTVWKVAFNSSRSGIRLEGPSPKWARSHGGEGGSHPSNMLGFGYPIGGLSFTGDSAVVFSADSPGQSGFICLQTVITSQLWKLGQLSPGDEIRFSPCSWSEAVAFEQQSENVLKCIKDSVQTGTCTSELRLNVAAIMGSRGRSVLYERPEGKIAGLPRFVIRQAGDRGLLCDYGSQNFNLNYRARAQKLILEIRDRTPTGFRKASRPHTNSALILFDPNVIDQDKAVARLVDIEAALQDTRNFQIPSRIFHLPLIFDARECFEANKRYMETQRPYATYLPDNVDFIRRSNGLKTREDVLKSVVEVPFLVLTSGGLMGLPIFIHIDPRLRFTVPKTNPSRTSTPAGAVGTGGTTSCVYPVESPGGYLLWGMTIAGCPFDTFGSKPGFSVEKPWLFEPFDRVVFHSVTRAEYDDANRRFQAGMYPISVEEGVFDLGTYNDLVDSTKNEVAELIARQQGCAAIELERENKLYQQWTMEKEAERAKQEAEKSNVVDHNDTEFTRVVSTMNARVWKILANSVNDIKAGDNLLILEAMKMEINVHAPPDHENYELVKLLVKEGDMVSPGDMVALLQPRK